MYKRRPLIGASFDILRLYATLVQMKKIQVITLFPEMFEGVLNSSMMWKAQKEGAVEFSTINLRDYGVGPRKQVDDTPYGGGDGMLPLQIQAPGLDLRISLSFS